MPWDRRDWALATAVAFAVGSFLISLANAALLWAMLWPEATYQDLPGINLIHTLVKLIVSGS